MLNVLIHSFIAGREGFGYNGVMVTIGTKRRQGKTLLDARKVVYNALQGEARPAREREGDRP
jgi:hypothetical protein